MNGTHRPHGRDSANMILLPTLYARAERFHRQYWSSGCDCSEEGEYPCEECLAEIAHLIELLDNIVRDAIRVTSSHWERLS